MQDVRFARLALSAVRKFFPSGELSLHREMLFETECHIVAFNGIQCENIAEYQLDFN